MSFCWRNWWMPWHYKAINLWLMGTVLVDFRGSPIDCNSVWVCQDSLHANTIDTMPLPSHEPWSESYCKRILIVIMRMGLRRYGQQQQYGLALYSPGVFAECRPLKCQSVVGSEQLSDTCDCYWGRRWIRRWLPSTEAFWVCTSAVSKASCLG